MHNLQPQNYLQKAGFINNIKLTLREVDIIACILTGRIAKTMAGVLGIETRTYETHYANVKKKLQINTKEHLISLIENETARIAYKNHASLLQIEKIILEYAATQKLEKKSFAFYIEKTNNILFFDLLRRHLNIFNITIHIKSTDTENTTSYLNFSIKPYENNIDDKRSFHIHFQSQPEKNSDQNFYFKQDIEYFDFLIFLIEKLNGDTNIFYLKQKIQNILVKRSEVFQKIYTPTKHEEKTHLERASSNISILKKIWILIGAVTSVSSLLLLIPSISTQTILQHNLRAMHMIGGSTNILKRVDMMQSIETALLNQKIENPDAIRYITLVGISGSGKTTLATNYAEQNSKMFVWELNAQTHSTLKQSYLQLAYSLSTTHELQNKISLIEKIRDPEIFLKQLLRFIQEELKNKKEWLLIFDNATNLHSIECFLPRHKNLWGDGSIIITTTNSNIETSTPTNNDIISVLQLSDMQAKELFCTIFYKSSFKTITRIEQQSVINLLNEIPNFPLDITLAAQYLRHTNAKFADYIQTLREESLSSRKFSKALYQETGVPLPRSVLLRFTIENILKVDPSFQDLLHTISRFNFKHIPKKLLLSYFNEDIVNAFILTLKKYSFIVESYLPHINEDERFISIHPFIQEYCRVYFKTELNQSDQDRCNSLTINGILKYYNTIPKNQYKTLSMLSEHVKKILEHNNKTSLTNLEMYQLYVLLGKIYYGGSRELINAKQAFEKALTYKAPQQHTHETTDVFLNMANICNDIVNPKSAIIYAQQAINSLKTTKNNTQYALAYFELGIAHLLLNNIKAAEQSLNHALNSLNKIKTKDALELASQITAYKGWMRAATFLMFDNGQALHDADEALNMITDNHNLRLHVKTAAKLRAYHYTTKGDILCKQGKFEKAMSQGFSKTQEVIATKLSESPHFILNIYLQIGIGECLLRTGQIKKAQTIFDEMLKNGELLLGKNCPLLYAPRVFLMETYMRLNQLDAAETVLDKIHSDTKTDDTIFSNFIECLFLYNTIILYKRQNNAIKMQEKFYLYVKKIQLFYQYPLLQQLYIDNLEDLIALQSTQHVDMKVISVCRKLLTNIYPDTNFLTY